MTRWMMPRSLCTATLMLSPNAAATASRVGAPGAPCKGWAKEGSAGSDLRSCEAAAIRGVEQQRTAHCLFGAKQWSHALAQQPLGVTGCQSCKSTFISSPKYSLCVKWHVSGILRPGRGSERLNRRPMLGRVRRGA